MFVAKCKIGRWLSNIGVVFCVLDIHWDDADEDHYQFYETKVENKADQTVENLNIEVLSSVNNIRRGLETNIFWT